MKNNFFQNIPEITEELIEQVSGNKKVKIERIVSRGHCSDADLWYDQQQNEWVILLKGEAGLEIKGEKDEIILKPGDYLLIPAHKEHRVAWTSKDEDTVWLAVHYD
jgi:cupin 2 domain-containing protein